MTSLPTCAVARGAIERHFHATAHDERALRAHLHDCASCRAYYDRRLLVEQLEPAALGPERRLQVGLGLAPRASRRGARLWAPLAAAALLLLLVLPRLHPSPEFRARGNALAPAGPALWVYRVSPAGQGQPVRDEMRRSDELAFAYRAPAEARFLLVFGRDEHGHVYWYHPEWTDANRDPASVAIANDSVRHELPAAIAHTLDGSVHEVCGVFSRDPFAVREIEKRLDRASARELERLEGVHVLCQTLRVAP
jgi:hypothetical protein